MLALAEVPARLADSRELGPGYAFDGPGCLRRLGAVLGGQSAAAQVSAALRALRCARL